MSEQARLGGFRTSARRMAAAVGAALVVMWSATDGLAQQAPSGGLPTAEGVNTRERPLYGHTTPAEAEMFRALRGVEGQVTIPDKRAAKLIQPQGRDWRATVEGPVRVWGAWLILGMVGALIVFYAYRGRIMIDGGATGRTIERFGDLARAVHWMTASAFVVLALTGLNVTYGRYLLLPILGYESFSAWSIFAKLVHNFVAFPFMLGVVVMFLQWVPHNILNRYDLEWMAKGGGLFAEGVHPPASLFNFGQKAVFWAVIIGGAVIAYTGIMLLFPFYFGDIHDQQLMAVLHAVTALLLVMVMIAHIYIGSIGMEGAFEAMYTGQVDERWARNHHSVWLAETRGGGRPR